MVTYIVVRNAVVPARIAGNKRILGQGFQADLKRLSRLSREGRFSLENLVDRTSNAGVVGAHKSLH